jgi:hypothetical protein
MKVIEGRKYLDTQRFDLADYMNNFSRGSQAKDPQMDRNKNKLTLADLRNYVNKSSKTFLIDKQSDY